MSYYNEGDATWMFISLLFFMYLYISTSIYAIYTFAYMMKFHNKKRVGIKEYME